MRGRCRCQHFFQPSIPGADARPASHAVSLSVSLCRLLTPIRSLIAYPVGKFLAYALPINDYDLPRWLGGGTFSFNPGPFNIKVCVWLPTLI